MPTSVTDPPQGSTGLTAVGNNFFLGPVGGSGPELKYRGAPFTAGEFGAWTPIAAEKTAHGYLVAWENPRANAYAVEFHNNAGNYLGQSGILSGNSVALNSLENIFHQDLNGDGVIGFAAPGSGSSGAVGVVNFVASGSTAFGVANTAAGSSSAASVDDGDVPVGLENGVTYEVTAPHSGSVAFYGPTGTLQLDQSSSFSGTVSGMSGQDTIDFTDINSANVQNPTYSGSASGGMLTVTDGTHTANIALLGNYLASTFVAASDGHGGTAVVDQALISSNQQPNLTTPQPT